MKQLIVFIFYLFVNICINKPPNIKIDFKMPNISKNPVVLRNLQGLLEELKRSQTLTKEELQRKIIQQLQEGSRKEDQEMCEEIATDFINDNFQNQYNSDDINRLIIQDNKLFYYTEDWKIKMYVYLIHQYQIEIDQDHEFLQEVLNDPDYYGINYDSYKILNFDLQAIKRQQ